MGYRNKLDLTSSSLLSSGGCDQHCPSRGPEAAVSQDQDGGRQHDFGRGHPPHPQRRVHGLPVPQRHRRRLAPGNPCADLGPAWGTFCPGALGLGGAGAALGGHQPNQDPLSSKHDSIRTFLAEKLMLALPERDSQCLSSHAGGAGRRSKCLTTLLMRSRTGTSRMLCFL